MSTICVLHVAGNATGGVVGGSCVVVDFVAFLEGLGVAED